MYQSCSRFCFFYVLEALRSRLINHEETPPKIKPRIKLKIKPIKDNRPKETGEEKEEEEELYDSFNRDVEMGEDEADENGDGDEDEEEESEISKDSNKSKMAGLQSLYS